MSKTNYCHYTKPGAPFSDDHTPGVWPGKDLWRSHIWVFPEYKIIKKCMERDHSPTAVKDAVDALVEITKHVVAKIDYSKEFMETAYKRITENPKDNLYRYTLDCSYLQTPWGEPRSWIERHINLVWYSILSIGLAMPASEQPKLLDFIFELNTRHVPHPDPDIERYLTTTHNSLWFDASLPGVWIGHRLFKIIDWVDLQDAQGEPLFERNIDGIVTLAAQLYLRRRDSDEPDFHPPHQAPRLIAYKYWIIWSIRNLIRPVVQPFFKAPWQNRKQPRIPEPLIRACCLWISYLAPFIYKTCVMAERCAIHSGDDPEKIHLSDPCLLSYSKWRNGLAALLRQQQPTFNPYVHKLKRLSESTENLIRSATDAMNRAEQHGEKLDPNTPRWEIVGYLRDRLLEWGVSYNEYIYSYDQLNARPRWIHKDVYFRGTNTTLRKGLESTRSDDLRSQQPGYIYVKNTSSSYETPKIVLINDDKETDIDSLSRHLNLNQSLDSSDDDEEEEEEEEEVYSSDGASVPTYSRARWSKYAVWYSDGGISSSDPEEDNALRKKEKNTDQFERRFKARQKTAKDRSAQKAKTETKTVNGKSKTAEHESKSSRKGKGTGKDKSIERELDMYYGKPAKLSASDEESH